MVRIILWQRVGLYDYGRDTGRWWPLTVGLALTGHRDLRVDDGFHAPFVLKRLGFDPATASAPFVATLVDVTGLVIYFSVASLVLRGTVL